jgi:SAM-dependent methyltransferase
VGQRHTSSRDAVHDYWLDPPDPWERPENYVGRFERSVLLHDLLDPRVARSDRILEVGCGAGANLTHLYRHGYRTLAGVELNPEMLGLFETHAPDVFHATDVRRGAVETVVDSLATDSVDATVAVAVLAHLHPSSEFVFDELVRVTDGHLVTIENERTDDDVFFPRNYADVFEARGCTQVEVVDSDTVHDRTELSRNCVARVFAVDG